MRLEEEFENERLRLIRTIEQTQVTTDAIEWSFNINDFAKAVPHANSFLKDRDFPRQLAVLTHEITHVLSFLGDVGAALLALRVAGLEISLDLWKGSNPHRTNFLEIFKDSHGVAPLVPGDAAWLLPAERQLEIRRKSQILLNVWTPWLEGLAVYGELGADPEIDPTTINPVTECVLNLVDFFRDQRNPRSSIEDEIRSYLAAFEKRCSEALKENGPRRLEDYSRKEQEPYFHGYVAVRAIAARWRATTGRNLSSAQCFKLLLHATRYGVRRFIPDLGLYSTDFALAVQQGLVV
jgi:hypothetical protein